MPKIHEIFTVRAAKQENDFIVTVGKHLATKKHFKSKEEAENYMKYPKWDTVIALIAEIMETENEQKNKE